MTSSTHVSAGRRRRIRLRRSAIALAFALVAGGTAGYAAWHGSGEASPHEHDGRAAAAAQRTGGRTSARPTGKAKPGTGTAAAGKPRATGAFAPVVTDRIPTPTTSLPLSAAIPGTTNMQPAAATAVKAAFAAARADGLAPEIRSAWRSAAWQQVLFDRAVRTYGSATEAAKWVLSPERSAHVKGYAVDVQPQAAAAWLEHHGAAYGLCRTYDNEWWHFEYLATSSCPPRQPTAAG